MSPSQVWDRFTATLGVPSEGLVEEQTEGEKRFPLLTYYTAYKVESESWTCGIAKAMCHD